MEQSKPVLVLGGKEAAKMDALSAVKIFSALSTERQKEAMGDIEAQNREKQEKIASPAMRQAFETQFGIDQSRTPAQWRNLVKMYGMDRVCLTENMSVDQVNQRMNESFTAYYKRVLKEKKANV